MAELLLGGQRTGRDHTVKDPDPGKAFPGGEIYLSIPGLGDLIAARVAGEIGEHIPSSTAPPVCSATQGPPRSPADPARAISWSPAGWRTTTTSAPPPLVAGGAFVVAADRAQLPAEIPVWDQRLAEHLPGARARAGRQGPRCADDVAAARALAHPAQAAQASHEELVEFARHGRHGWPEALVDAEFTVIPVNPDVVARRRGPARKKDDAEDARICCLLALDRHAAVRSGELLQEGTDLG